MRRLAGLALACSLAATAVAARAAEPPAVLAAADRDVEGARAVHVAVAQNRIESSVEIGRVAADNSAGGGLLGAILIASMDNKREILADSATQRAEATIAPLRGALDGFDVDALALATTQAALTGIAWFHPQDVTLSKDASVGGREAFLAAAPGQQAAFVTYRYDLSPDFTQIRVFAEVSLARKGKPRGKRGEPSIEPLYTQPMVAIVQLGTRSYEPRDNVARWSADGGERARAALTTAFARLERLIPHALDLSAADAKGLTDKKHEKAFAAGEYGPLIRRGFAQPDDVLIWSDGLVYVQTLPTS